MFSYYGHVLCLKKRISFNWLTIHALGLYPRSPIKDYDSKNYVPIITIRYQEGWKWKRYLCPLINNLQLKKPRNCTWHANIRNYLFVFIFLFILLWRCSNFFLVLEVDRCFFYKNIVLIKVKVYFFFSFLSFSYSYYY